MKLKEKLKSLSEALAAIEKQFGAGTVMTLGSSPAGSDVPSFSSGSFGLDRALGIGGYPRGRLVEIFGPEASGKTTLTLHAIAEVQRQGGIAAFIDAEHALDVTYARRLGVDADHLLVAQPDHGEQALGVADALIGSGGVDLVVIDSVAALVPKAELDGEMEDQQVGLQARMMSKAMRKLTGITHRTGATIIFINQIRQKIGVQFGNPETTTGGNALKFYASVRLDVRRLAQVKEKGNEDAVGNRVKVNVVKNKLAPPFRKAEFDIRFGEGIDRAAELFDLAVDEGVLDRSGAHFSFGGERIGHGRDAALGYLRQAKEAQDTIAAALRERAAARAAQPPAPKPAAEEQAA